MKLVKQNLTRQGRVEFEHELMCYFQEFFFFCFSGFIITSLEVFRIDTSEKLHLSVTEFLSVVWYTP